MKNRQQFVVKVHVHVPEFSYWFINTCTLMCAAKFEKKKIYIIKRVFVHVLSFFRMFLTFCLNTLFTAFFQNIKIVFQRMLLGE